MRIPPPAEHDTVDVDLCDETARQQPPDGGCASHEDDQSQERQVDERRPRQQSVIRREEHVYHVGVEPLDSKLGRQLGSELLDPFSGHRIFEHSTNGRAPQQELWRESDHCRHRGEGMSADQ